MNLIGNLRANIFANYRLDYKINSGLLLIIAAAILWGTSGIAAKHIITTYEVSTLTIGALRLLIATPVLLITARVQTNEKIVIEKEHYRFFILYGINVALYQITYFTAVKLSMVSIATLIALCTAPIFVAILSRMFFSEKLTPKMIGALCMSMLGTTFIIGLGSNGALTRSNYLGYLLALGAGFAYASFTLCGKKLVKHYKPLSVVSIAFIVGTITMLPFLRIPKGISLNGWIILIYLGIVPTAIAYLLFNIGLKKSSATKASIATLCEPLTATTLSLIFIGERFSQVQSIGAVLLIIALIMVALKNENLK